ncbi:GxxExxY protein [Rhodocaloribacter litoris]|uniref:GxxExxY protein n=1 Tax=Rhodocaloribacter litoris TaxID=2558931 RepID=UPI00141F7025|nr:GxxExxY protein [Rhodocaloribacter litoris]QXD16590.1 GxxExxY protein [Rhodocaloribacter litoris]
MLHEDITGRIIRAFYQVYNTLGYGFLEKVYEKAMAIELARNGLDVIRQKPIDVYYGEERVGEYFADLVVNDMVIIELKAVDLLHPNHTHQLVNYLKATDIEVGLLLNFGEKPEVVRRIFTNDRKRHRSAPHP